MILTFHQPAYLPWLGLFHKIALADLYIVYDQVQYVPNNWQNRNQIKTPAGPVWLSVPVLRRGYRDKHLYEIEIHNAVPWARKHWQTIRSNYGKARYFKDYAQFFEDTYHRGWETLAELTDYMLRWFLDTLRIRTPVRSAREFNFKGKKSDLALDMCRTLDADTCIFGARGRDYADVAAFHRANVDPVFQDYKHPVYPQLHGDFISHLGIVDLLFNCGPHSLEILMSGNVTRDHLLSLVSVREIIASS